MGSQSDWETMKNSVLLLEKVFNKNYNNNIFLKVKNSI